MRSSDSECRQGPHPSRNPPEEQPVHRTPAAVARSPKIRQKLRGVGDVDASAGVATAVISESSCRLPVRLVSGGPGGVSAAGDASGPASLPPPSPFECVRGFLGGWGFSGPDS